MARIARVSAREAGQDVELALRFTRGGLAELTHLIAVENMRGRFNLALGVGSAGFSEGMVCAVPATVPQSAPRSAATS
jgi:hypothetical protein